MSTAQSMVTEITNYLNKLIAMFAGTKGTTDQVLFVNNPNGVFAFTPGMVSTMNSIATTASEVTRAKAAMVADPTVGTLLINQSTARIERLNVATGVWSATAADYATVYVLPERFIYSPWNKTVWYVNKNGVLKRFLTSGLTPVG